MKKLATAGKDKQVELSPIHDFAAKLRQPEVLARLKDYVRWQVAWRKARAEGQPMEELLSSAPDRAPMSINLDTALGASLVCKVLKTICPVKDALMAISAVSRSRISPTITILGACLNIARRAAEKVMPTSDRTWT